MNQQWQNAMGLSPRVYVCGYCDTKVGPDRGFTTTNGLSLIYVCSSCARPTYFEDQRQWPGVSFGENVEHLPSDVAGLYTEARQCMSVSSYTSAVLTCRKLLMHIAVTQGAPEGKSFLEYVEFLASKGYLPPNGKGWVEVIRIRGNEANHEIKIMAQKEAEELITFLEMLLKFIYEFPLKIGVPAPKTP